MKTNNNSEQCICPGCQLKSSVFGLIAGIISGILFFRGSTPLINNSIWIAFSIAAFVLVYVLGVLFFSSCTSLCIRTRYCLKKNIGCLLTGSIGTIITSIAALTIDLLIGVPSVAFLIGLGVFFFVHMIVSMVTFIRCYISDNNDKK